MNKNLFLAMFAAAGMLSVTSCTHQELDAVQDSEMPQISFSLGVENTVGTKAISDGTGATKLIYAVYDANGALLSTINGADNNGQFVNDNAFDSNLKANVSITLAKGQTYSVAFWAQDPNCTAYDTQDLTAVTIDYDGINNDETRDAFFAAVTFTVEGNKEIDVTLVRPFAQINVGVTSEDWNAAVNSGVDIVSSSVVISNAANTINLLTGAVTGEEEVTYTLNAIPNETLYVETDAASQGLEAYKWVSMSYILVADGTDTDSDNDGTLGDARAALESIQFTFNPVSGNAITFMDGLDNVPVQRNWRTNILGKILTGSIQFNVTIDPAYIDDINYPDGTMQQQLEFAATFGGTVTLTEDVVLTAPLTTCADMVINFGNYTLTNPNGYVIENCANLTLYGNENGGFTGLGGIRSNGGKVTINGGTYTCSSDWNTGTFQHILKAVNTEVVINDGIFDATLGGTTNAMLNASQNAVITINGGTFRNVNGTIPQFAPYLFTYEQNGKVIINDGTFYGGWRFNGTTSTTDIYGGNFTVSYDGQSFHANSTHVLTVYGGSFSLNNGGILNPTKYVADGYYAVKNNNNTYIVYAIDAATRTIVINNAATLLNLNSLNANWVALFSNGSGTDYNSYVVANGGKGTDFYYKWTWNVKLAEDIDLGGITLTTPVKVDTWGSFNGGNNTISNVNVVTATDVETAAGLFDSGTCSLNNIVLDNVNVQGSFVGNSTAGILASDCNAGVNNITITNSSVNGGKYTGGVIGYGYTDITNCTLTNCTVKGGYKCGGIIGYICASTPEQLRSADGHTLTGCTVDGAGQYADGKTMYIIGKVVGNYNANGTCNDNTITNMTTTATANIGEIEAGKTVVQN